MAKVPIAIVVGPGSIGAVDSSAMHSNGVEVAGYIGTVAARSAMTASHVMAGCRNRHLALVS